MQCPYQELPCDLQPCLAASCRGNGFYPGTGDVADLGKGPGRGFNLNIPFPRGGFNDADYVAAFDLVHLPLKD